MATILGSHQDTFALQCTIIKAQFRVTVEFVISFWNVGGDLDPSKRDHYRLCGTAGSGPPKARSRYCRAALAKRDQRRGAPMGNFEIQVSVRGSPLRSGLDRFGFHYFLQLGRQWRLSVICQPRFRSLRFGSRSGHYGSALVCTDRSVRWLLRSAGSLPGETRYQTNFWAVGTRESSAHPACVFDEGWRGFFSWFDHLFRIPGNRAPSDFSLAG